ncbi:polyketide synthase [Rubripirellula amarantea]|uniref:Polyketide synthase n=1 Tax=Rubripirellula amarantea TaxID=2527999 RepID=A0A5C5WUB0_9BACT|nr:polyketide synthase [Rubripirellula amarantea]MDA8744050.1 polyketide synthase [Rubripirellula amarantea]TWT54276.1 hypothetical protein Pla22_19180 [Rubripirellula amarantea]
MPTSPASSGYLDPRLTQLLEGLRHRVRRYVVWDSVLALAAVVLTAFWLGLALDYLPVVMGGTEMPWLARLLLLVVVAVVLVFIATKMLFGRLNRPLPDDSLALLVERHHPDLGGRLVTAVQLNRPGRDGDSHSAKLLRHVHDEAADAIDRVDPAKVFRLEPLIRKAMIVAPLLLMAVLMLVISPQAFGRAASRLTLLSDEPWPRRAHLEMVGVELPVVTAADNQNAEPQLVAFENKVVRLPRGSSGSLRIRAKADGDAELPVVCTVYYQTIPSDNASNANSAAGVVSSGQTNMRRVGRVIDGYQSFLLDGPPLASLSDSVEFYVRGLDDRLDGFRIEAVTPPAVADMKVRVRYPQYLQSDPVAASTGDRPDWDLESSYQSGLRVAEGSDVTLVATSSMPLGDADVMVKSINEQPVPFTTEYSDDRTELRLRINNFTNATTVSIVPRDVSGISAQAPYRYFLGVVLDEPPELKMKLIGIGSAVTPIAKIPVEASVIDDYGVQRLVVSVTPTKAGEEQPETGADDEVSLQVASRTPGIDRDGDAKTELDLRDLIANGELPELVPDDAINVIGEASDRYNLSGNHLTRSEIFRLQVVTPEKLLALLERRELALRARLEQTIDETRNLRDALSLLQRGFDSEKPTSTPDAEESTASDNQADTDEVRKNQVRRLRVQQSGLQASKTSEELSGIAASLEDLLLEMVNNRVDSVDRRERIGVGVRDPLRRIVEVPLAKLSEQIVDVERLIGDDEAAKSKTRDAVTTAEDVLLQLTAVLDKMLDLESYNEILDMVRGLIDDQDELLEDTKSERKKRVLDLFQ